MNKLFDTHPLGKKAKVLLTSVFGPYAQDDEFGSRTINPMELYHNQVTRVQKGFSLRMFHRSFGLMFIQANIDAPCTLLDFPVLERFVQEIKENAYDVIGISAISMNIGKVVKMCELIREHAPQAEIVVGGHIAALEDIENRIDADHIVRGDGVKWFRRYLGQKEDTPYRHPLAISAENTRIFGVTVREKPGETAALLVPSVGCPMGCNFCSTSALFGGKGNFINFYETGDELYQVLCQLEEKLNVRSFFVMDENFLLHRKRALRLLELMAANNKSWSFYVFSSARVVQSYDIEQLIRLGISWVWMGLEGKKTQYRKLNDIDTKELITVLQSHGIRVLGSSIIGLETHTPENIHEAIDYAVSHKTDFHQFMLYTPNPGTPLYEEMKAQGRMKADFDLADAHGQYRFNYHHSHIREGQEQQYLLDAFNRDFEVNGPSIARMMTTMLKGYKKYKNHPDAAIRERYQWEMESLRYTYAGAVWAMKKWYKNDPRHAVAFQTLYTDICREFGWKTKIAAPIIGRYVYRCLVKEDRRLAEGWTLEPVTHLEKNEAALKLEAGKTSAAQTDRSNRIQWISIEADAAEGHKQAA